MWIVFTSGPVHLENGSSFVAFSLKTTNLGSSVTISESKCICSINMQCAILLIVAGVQQRRKEVLHIYK